VDDPYPNMEFGLASVIRSDGSHLPRENCWRTSRIVRYQFEADVEEKFLHLFDYNSTGIYHVILTRDYGTTGTTGTTGKFTLILFASMNEF
jgi:hypothetical protein